MNKIDRALEMQVIDWLQWSNFNPKDEKMAVLALELIETRRLYTKILEARLEALGQKIDEQ